VCSHVCALFSADNVLLSDDGKDAFLCDFGHSERLDKQGLSEGQGKYLKHISSEYRRMHELSN